MKDENYIVIQGWMVNRLKLTGNELSIYALIYGFSQDGESVFSGSCQYIAEAVGSTKRAAMGVLKKLFEKGFILKFKSGKSGNLKCDYGVNMEVVKNMTDEKFSPVKGQPMKNFHRSDEKFSPVTDEKFSHHIAINNKLEINKFSPPKMAEKKQDLSSKNQSDLTPEQLDLFHAAKTCFENSEESKALIYQDKVTTAWQMKNIKLLVFRCSNIAPGKTADFLKNILEHFYFMTRGKLRGKVEFTPRALMTPWIWESVIGSLPKIESPELKDFAKGLFK